MQMPEPTLNQKSAGEIQFISVNHGKARDFYILGNTFKDQGDLDQAIKCYHQAIALNPNHTEAYNNLGNSYKLKKELNKAIVCYQKASQINPYNEQVFYNLGILYGEIGLIQEAMKCYRRTIKCQPRFVDAHFNLGNLLRELGEFDGAIECYRKALDINPDYAEAYNGLGTVYQEQGRLNEAAAFYRKHLQIKSDASIEVKAAMLLPVICESNLSITNFRRTFARNIDNLKRKALRLQDPSKEVGRTNFFLAYHGLDNKDLQVDVAKFYLDACPLLGRQPSSNSSRSRIDSRTRIGIISRYLRGHTIGYLNYGLIKYLDREKFNVTVFGFPGMRDDLSMNIAEAAHQFIILPAKLSTALKIIAREALDVLMYPDIGMDPLTYFLAFSRLAPVQCTTWGHPDTTGIPNMDYYISSASAEPPGAQAHYTEKLILFDQFPMYCRRPAAPGRQLTRRHLNLPEDVHLYACIQSLFKIHPDFDDIIAGILRRDPESIILFFEGKHAQWGDLLRQRFARQIPDVCNRVRFLKRLTPEDFMAFLKIPDVLLDTIHFSGGYTSLLAFSSGTPIVTWPGAFMRGRLTYSFYAQMDVLDTVVDSPEAYIHIACELANDRHRNEELRARIKRRAGCLYDNPAPVYELENFFRWASRQAKGNRN